MTDISELKNKIKELNSLDADGLLENYELIGGNYLDSLANFTLDDIDKYTFIFEIISIYARNTEIRNKIHEHYPTIYQSLSTCYRNINNKLSTKLDLSVLKNSRIQLLRAIGNLSIDDDLARQRLLDTGLTTLLTQDLNSNLDNNTRKFLTGCLLNSSLNYTPMRKNLLENDIIDGLMISLNRSQLENSQEMTVYFGIRFLSNLFDEDNATKIFAEKYDNIAYLIDILDYYNANLGPYDIEIMEYLVEIIELILTENENYYPRLVSDGHFQKLLNFLNNSIDISSRYPDQKKEISQICTTIERHIVLISSHDDNLTLFENKEFINRMIEWLDQTEDPQLRSCSALVLGNLARTTENCVRSVQEFNFHIKIYKIIETTEDLAIQHAMIGLLKNLCLPAENKSIIGSIPFIRLISPLLEKVTAPPLQFNVIGVLKHLSSRNIQNALEICDEKNQHEGILPLTRLRKVIAKNDNQGIRSEATRALINVVKAVYSSKEYYNKYQPLLKDSSANDAIIDLVKQTQYPVLQNEGIIALTLLVVTEDSDVSDIMKAICEDDISNEEAKEGNMLTEQDMKQIVPFYSALGDILLAESKPYSVEMRLNTLTFIKHMLGRVKDDGILSVRQKLINLLKELRSILNSNPCEPLEVMLNGINELHSI